MSFQHLLGLIAGAIYLYGACITHMVKSSMQDEVRGLFFSWLVAETDGIFGKE